MAWIIKEVLFKLKRTSRPVAGHLQAIMSLPNITLIKANQPDKLCKHRRARMPLLQGSVSVPQSAAYSSFTASHVITRRISAHGPGIRRCEKVRFPYSSIYSSINRVLSVSPGKPPVTAATAPEHSKMIQVCSCHVSVTRLYKKYRFICGRYLAVARYILCRLKG